LGAVASDETLRVCHLCGTTLESHYFRNLGTGLAASGVHVLGASLTDPHPPGWLKAAPDDYLFLDAPTKPRLPGAAVRLARWLKTKRVDVLQTHLFEGALVGLAAGRLARTPLTIVTRHHTDEMWIVGTRPHRWVDRLITRAADRVVGLSQAVGRHMITREWADPEKIEILPQGFDFTALSATDTDRQRVRDEFGLEASFVVGCVARFYRTKGHRYLLAAARQLTREIPNLKVLLLGGGDRTAIEGMVRENGLEDRVIFAGYRGDVPACLRAMDVVVHPSLTEAFCQAVVEALAAEAPLIVTNVAGAPEVVTDGEHGLLVPPADSDAIVDAILRIYRDPALAHRMAEAGRRRVMAEFTIDRMVRAQLDCYERWLPAAEPRARGADVLT
jgi:glycosyltransferase involved in cell wall biosynthesis